MGRVRPPAVAVFGVVVACSGSPQLAAPDGGVELQAQQLLQQKFSGNAVAVLPFDPSNPQCLPDVGTDPEQLDAAGFATCTGADASGLPAALQIVTDPLLFDPAVGPQSVLAVLAPGVAGDPHLEWYAVVGLGNAAALGISSAPLGSTSQAAAPGLRPMNALVVVGAGALEAFGLTIPGVDIFSGVLLAGTALYIAKQASTPNGPTLTLNGIASEVTDGVASSLVFGSESGTCDTDQECCLEDGTADPQDPPGPPDSASASSLPDLEVSKFEQPGPPTWWGRFVAYQDGIKALNTETGETVTLRYVVSGDLRRFNEILKIGAVSVVPIVNGFGAAMNYTYRPGAGGMKAMMDAVAKVIAEQCPWADKLLVNRSRVTEGYQGEKCREKQYDLTRLR